MDRLVPDTAQDSTQDSTPSRANLPADFLDIGESAVVENKPRALCLRNGLWNGLERGLSGDATRTSFQQHCARHKQAQRTPQTKFQQRQYPILYSI